MDAVGACDSDVCCCSCDVDVYECECDFECCDGACGELCEVCGLEEGIETICCGFLLCADSKAAPSGNEKGDKRAEATAKAISEAPLMTVKPVRVELLGISNPQSKPELQEPQLTSV